MTPLISFLVGWTAAMSTYIAYIVTQILEEKKAPPNKEEAK